MAKNDIEWLVYAKPELDAASGKWIVKVTKSNNSEFLENFEFDSEQLGLDFLKQKSLDQVKNSKQNKLTPIQEQAILDKWNSGSQNLIDLVEVAFPGQGHDGRDWAGLLVRKYLSSRQLKAKSSFTYQSKTSEFLLEESQKEFIRNHLQEINNGQLTILDVAKELFPNVKNLSNFSKEYRVIHRFLKTLAGYEESKTEVILPYLPPRNINTVIERVNKYVHGVNLQQEKLTTKQKNDLNALMSYLHSLRFTSSINLFKKLDERDLMESEFIRFTYDKGDLSAEEISSYVMLALEAPNMNRKQVEIERLSELLQNSAEDSEGKKVSIGLSDAIHNAESELDNCKKRQKDLIKVLVGNRSDRLKNKMAETRSVLSLVEAAKHKDMRDQMIKIAKKQEEILGKEVDRLADMDSLKASIFGISKDEILNG